MRGLTVGNLYVAVQVDVAQDFYLMCNMIEYEQRVCEHEKGFGQAERVFGRRRQVLETGGRLIGKIADGAATETRQSLPLYAKLIAEREQSPEPDATAAVESAPAAANAASDAGELCELFFAAGGPERRLILLNLDYAPTEPAVLPAALQRADIWRLETAALRHETDVVMRELQRALGVSSQQARRIVDDELGEPIVVAAKAMNLPADMLQRLLLFLNFKVGQSVDRVYELISLYSAVSVDAARRLVAIWREADPAKLTPTRHQSLPWHHAAENARRALSEISRPATEQAPRRDIIRTR